MVLNESQVVVTTGVSTVKIIKLIIKERMVSLKTGYPCKTSSERFNPAVVRWFS